MAIRLAIDIAGDVVEWQKLLNGLQSVTLVGASADGAWTLTAACSWNARTGSTAEDGDVTLTRSDGAELFGELVGGAVAESEAGDIDAADYAMTFEFDIDGGAVMFEGASGTLRAEGRLWRDGFECRVIVETALAR
jgi:hypothetical protein